MLGVVCESVAVLVVDDGQAGAVVEGVGRWETEGAAVWSGAAVGGGVLVGG